MIEIICCVCGKVKRDGDWVDGQPAAGARLSHGYCHQCTERAMEELRALKARSANPKGRAVA
jgi:hypothetical protein